VKNRRDLFLLLTVLCFAVIAGCAAVPEKPQRPAAELPVVKPQPQPLPPGPVPETPSVTKYRALGMTYEKSGQLQKALLMWEAVAFLSGEAEAERKAEEVRERIRTTRESHLVAARAYLRNGSEVSARKELLLALSCDPGHHEALDMLRKSMYDSDYLIYEVREGDTPSKVARQVYGDAGKAFLVVYFSDLSGEEQLKAGTDLRLPIVDGEGKPGGETEGKARVAAIPKSPERQAEKTIDRSGAERHYNKGVAHFLIQELPQAVKEWEEALRLNPEHPNAGMDLQKARNIMKKRGQG
jgi:tetratricopeptide (TPR) repeat protein